MGDGSYQPAADIEPVLGLSTVDDLKRSIDDLDIFSCMDGLMK